jgi:hypothetical protein
MAVNPSRAEQREKRLNWLAAELAKAFPQMRDPMEAAIRIDDAINGGMARRTRLATHGHDLAHLEEPPPR